MEALKFLAFVVGMSVAVAGAITFLVSLAIAPLERMRLRWLERERQAIKEAPTSA
jgi:ABC-type cobalamin transport system permease subunit